MGIREKILTLFVVGFGVMTTIAVVLLFRDLNLSFAEIETNDAQHEMHQLIRNFEAELEHLDELNTDWANWDGLYQFAVDGNEAFQSTEIAPPTLISAKLNLMAVLDTKGNRRVAHAVDLETGNAVKIEAFEPALQLVGISQKSHGPGHRCGLARNAPELMLMCWQPIRRADHTGDNVGTLIMGRLFRPGMLKRMREQSGLNFTVTSLPTSQERFPLARDYHIGFDAMRFDENTPGKLNTRLVDLQGEPVLGLSLHFPQEVSRQGEIVSWRVVMTLTIVTLLNGIALMIGVHYLLTRRLKKLSLEVAKIAQDGDWSMHVSHLSGKDELVSLSRHINRLLDVIRRKTDALETLTLTDPMTHIANRRAFDRCLATEMAQSSRDGKPLALLLVDVDFFKRYNDHYGHPAGDEVLKAVAQCLASLANRPHDLAARIGGEEFALVLHDTHQTGAYHVAEQLRAAIAARHIEHADSPVGPHLTVSIGIAIAGKETPSSLISRADLAVYKAKDAGRNQACSLPTPES